MDRPGVYERSTEQVTVRLVRLTLPLSYQEAQKALLEAACKKNSLDTTDVIALEDVRNEEENIKIVVIRETC